MASLVDLGVGGAGAVEEERERLLATLIARVDELAARAVEAIRAEIPAYDGRDDHFYRDVADQCASNYMTKLTALLEGREWTLEDISFVRAAATRRARSGFALEDYLNAYRVGQQALWDALLAEAGDSPVAHEAALTLVAPVMRYVDFVSTHAARAYVEYERYVVADADRERRDLLEHLLAGELPPGGPLLGAAHGYGLGAQTRALVVVAAAATEALDSDGSAMASAAITRVGLREAKTLVVVRQSEIVAVPALGPAADATPLCAALEDMQLRLEREGMPLAVGISTVADGVAELPRAYREARCALECVAEDGGVAALPRLSPFEYLARRAEDTARRLIDPRVREFLERDRARGGVLIATIRAFADADLNLRVAAERLRIHPNTAQYRLGKIEERTGRNVRHIADLLDLLVALALEDAGPPQ